jgi:hypothetical protein
MEALPQLIAEYPALGGLLIAVAFAIAFWRALEKRTAAHIEDLKSVADENTKATIANAQALALLKETIEQARQNVIRSRGRE